MSKFKLSSGDEIRSDLWCLWPEGGTWLPQREYSGRCNGHDVKAGLVDEFARNHAYPMGIWLYGYSPRVGDLIEFDGLDKRFAVSRLTGGDSGVVWIEDYDP